MIENRTELLIGTETFHKLQSINVILFGVGGVGSWCAETLVRSGVRNLTIIDFDTVAPSNINRQLPATIDTVVQLKVDVMRTRMISINLDANITAIADRFTPDNAPQWHLEQYDYIIDAIDSVADKAALMLHVASLPRPRLLSSMGAALKADPTRIAVAEFWKVKGCPLAAALRRRFKKSGVMPRRKFKCVYSDELLPNRGEDTGSRGAMTYGKVAVNGALCHITAIFGLTLAGLAVERIIQAHR